MIGLIPSLNMYESSYQPFGIGNSSHHCFIFHCWSTRWWVHYGNYCRCSSCYSEQYYWARLKNPDLSAQYFDPWAYFFDYQCAYGAIGSKNSSLIFAWRFLVSTHICHCFSSGKYGALTSFDRKIIKFL